MSIPTRAAQSYQNNKSTVDELIKARDVTDPVSHGRRAAFNKAAMIFLITSWEAYVEDLLMDATRRLAAGVSKFDELPESVWMPMVTHVREAKDSSAPKVLAGDGWRALMVQLAEASVKSLNTPNSKNIDRLFERHLGIAQVSESWKRQKFSAATARQRLDETISIRGSIVYTGVKPNGLNANWIKTHGGNLGELVKRTDISVTKNHQLLTGEPW